MKGGRFRSFLAACFAGGCNVVLILLPIPKFLEFVLTYLVLVFWELKIAFPEQNIYTYIKAFLGMYFFCFGMGGILKWIYENFPIANLYGRNILWFFGGVYFCFICISKICILIKEERQEKENLRLVICEVNGKILRCTGLWDTGNRLFEPLSKKPVLVLEKSELEKSYIYIRKEQYRIVPYHSIGTKHGILEAFVADRVVVVPMEDGDGSSGIEREKVVIGIYEGKLCQSEKYQMILHPEM